MKRSAIAPLAPVTKTGMHVGSALLREGGEHLDRFEGFYATMVAVWGGGKQNGNAENVAVELGNVVAAVADK